MDIQAPVRPTQQTAKELVREVLLGSQPGDIISVKATIVAVRERGGDLLETDCQLVEMIVKSASVWGLFIAFDVREA
ncbi:hypothetical protein NKH34_28310 [Mesorhizobium sp. M1148]|nr:MULTISPECIES: hypothetical protein [unclassified Mesorhizobium]ESW83400.1 hypothetical protein X773_11770 [Mesorhizobium sp. LSJC285A00]ESX02355.1 hypothetical protein X768_30765 [Mesorhizobium sp. LSJC265A00]ESX21431.1 hypothetical protein X766_00030 [Mesorhizobium sp. LSJC255A00]ESX28286.1 hypothetical protein X765_16780 [Mesorhizobium sp. LSHC440B00]ESX28767.1 hypothetical protein X767_01060 [Mesorhizobium sp. LSJC264A00]